MRKLVFTIGMMLFLGSALFAQEETSFKVTKVKKAAYFDVSEPLRDKEPIKPSERNRSWKDNIIQNEFIPPQKDDNRDIEDPVVQKDKGSREMRAPIHNFEGTGNLNGVYPPDTEGDVGEDFYFQMINLSFTIYDKEGNTVYGPADNSTLWDGFIGPWTGSNDGDPIVVYDEAAERWVASQFAVETSNGQYYELVAVSKTSDPTGEYYRYAFEYDDFNDYPKIGVWPDAYVATYNMFSGNFQGAGVAAFDREAMLAGEEDAEQQFFQLSSQYYGILPADFDGPAPPDSIPHYIVHNSNNPREIQIFEFTIDWENPSNSDITLEHSLEPENYTTASTNVPQPNTSTGLDDFIGQMMYPLKFRKFDDHLSMVMNHAVVTSFQAEHGIRWYEVRNTDGDWTIHQQSTYAPDDGLHRWLGSIAMNGNGDIALGFSVSGEEEVYPSIRYVARTADAPLGEMNTEEIEVIAGSSSQSGIERWGDYATMSVDPSDDTTFWFTSEYITGPWKTRIVSFNLEQPQEPVVDAGPDTVICQTNLYNTGAASSQYTNEHLWETSGDGEFVPTNDELEVNYLRGDQDIEDGNVTLTLTGYGYDEGLQDDDSMELTIVPLPEVNAGNDTTICTTSSYTTDPEVSSASMVQWSTSGDGEFENPTQANTVYNPGSEDISNGEVTLTLTASPQSPCTENEVDEVTVTFDVCTDVETVSAQNDGLSITPNPSQGEFTMALDSELSGNALVTIRNTSGSEVFRKTFSKQGNSLRENIDLSNLPNGVYFLRIQLKNKAFAEKIIVR
ncbi:MAG: T9SS type A sorting domain-containing protein [Bacteroidales bacterium]|nr:T9SS type A sorting domain-containing protein [Bacteroidales bacterium]MCF8334943.1 T9SS type A sorting domain-containing protein [Bacteroidales bacterium]